jgi:hypothetical protein
MSIMTKQTLQKWFVRLYIPALMLILTAGMLFVLKFGYTPVPPMVMTPSFFDQPSEIGAVAFRRFYAEIRERKIVVLGTPNEPAFHRDVVTGFLAAAAQDGSPFDVLIEEQQMPELVFPANMPAGFQVKRVPSNTETQAEMIDAIDEVEAKGQRAVVYLPNVFSTHILKGNALSRLERSMGQKFFAVTTGPLALANDQEYLVDPACVGTERDSMGVSELGCAILKAGRSFYKEMAKANLSEKENAKPKPNNQRRWVAIMNQPTQDEDYLLMISSPGQDKGNAAENKALRMNPPRR